MRYKIRVLILIIVAFVCLNAFADENPQLKTVVFPTLGADNAQAKSIILGSIDPKSGFKFELELSSKGAAVRQAIFSEFDDRDYKNPQPLVILSPVELSGGEILSMANTNFVFVEEQLQLPLDKLHWKSYDVVKDYDGSQTVQFEAIIKNADSNQPMIKLIKTYKIISDSYHLYFDITVENLTASEQKVCFELAGPTGLGREGVRGDMRKAVAGFRNAKSEITSTRLDVKKLSKAKSLSDRRLTKNNDKFLWVAAVNKYFAAIVVPVPDKGKDFCDWIADKTGRYYNPDRDQRGDSGDEAVGVNLKIASHTLAAVGQQGSKRTYNFQV